MRRRVATQSKKSATSGGVPRMSLIAELTARMAASAADCAVVLMMWTVAPAGMSEAQPIEPSSSTANGTRSL